MLTTREKQVASLISREHKNQEIAEALGISLETAKEHVANAIRKLKVKSRVGVAVWFVKGGVE